MRGGGLDADKQVLEGRLAHWQSNNCVTAHCMYMRALFDGCFGVMCQYMVEHLPFVQPAVLCLLCTYPKVGATLSVL